MAVQSSREIRREWLVRRQICAISEDVLLMTLTSYRAELEK